MFDKILQDSLSKYEPYKLINTDHNKHRNSTYHTQNDTSSLSKSYDLKIDKKYIERICNVKDNQNKYWRLNNLFFRKKSI